VTRILVVEDDCDIRSMLERGLTAEGFTVSAAERASEALADARETTPAAVVLDIMLPDSSGYDVCRALRAEGFTGPIVFLSAKDEVSDRVQGLSDGADDYIVKPFDFNELVARLRTQIVRRQGLADRTAIVAGRLSLDLVMRQVRFGAVTARLTQRETELLALLMQSPNRPLSRGEIFDELWASHGGLSLNVVDVYVGYLRIKLGDIARAGGPIIVTVRGRGFMLDLREPSPGL
jgi:two-component system OmpR family response regulator